MLRASWRGLPADAARRAAAVESTAWVESIPFALALIFSLLKSGPSRSSCNVPVCMRSSI